MEARGARRHNSFIISDLQIFHNGSASYISEQGTGNLVLGAADSIIFQYAAHDENMLVASQNGAVSLYYDNAIKIATSASGISVTGNVVVSGTVDGVDLQTLNTAVSANTSKTTNATHSGEVTGSGALTIANNVVDEANLKVSNSPTNGYMLTAQSGNTGGLTWAAAGGGAMEFINTTDITMAGVLIQKAAALMGYLMTLVGSPKRWEMKQMKAAQALQSQYFRLTSQSPL